MVAQAVATVIFNLSSLRLSDALRVRLTGIRTYGAGAYAYIIGDRNGYPQYMTSSRRALAVIDGQRHWPKIVSYQEGITKNGNPAQKHKAEKQHEGGRQIKRHYGSGLLRRRSPVP
ncbi:hypothetical protein ARMSODRAFT_979475 [Armillaria solidipes]|uniref:Uncharacterized protein n=1 Tax=Armillaria solidipes TaxID=1076256 RepID=A0A2H3AZL6_9AGAR|nr:hypothetical protein ARMSODRAFT_979475 [Armillaria solidipes]